MGKYEGEEKQKQIQEASDFTLFPKTELNLSPQKEQIMYHTEDNVDINFNIASQSHEQNKQSTS